VELKIITTITTITIITITILKIKMDKTLITIQADKIVVVHQDKIINKNKRIER